MKYTTFFVDSTTLIGRLNNKIRIKQISNLLEHTYTTSMEQEIDEANSMINLSGNSEAYDQLIDPYQPISTITSKY